MTTILRASPRRFVSTPAVERVASRALRYLQSGYSVHLRGPAGTGKTTLALHLADLLARPLMLIFGDDEFKTSDLIGNQSGYTRKRVVDNYIHSVVKVEDEVRQNWADSRLTLACREGFTLVYDEFNRSRPEVNNVLLSALEEKLLVLPPSNSRSEYVRVSPHFRAIFTSNPDEYCGVHATQDALMDRLVTISMPEPDELTQQEILVQKTEVDRASALLIVRLVKEFRIRTNNEKSSGLRSCLMLGKVCHDHEILATPSNADFRDLCSDVLLSRSSLPLKEATQILWELLNETISMNLVETELSETEQNASPYGLAVGSSDVAIAQAAAIAEDLEALAAEALTAETAPLIVIATEEPTDSPNEMPIIVTPSESVAPIQEAVIEAIVPAIEEVIPYEQEILAYLKQVNGARLSQIEQALALDRFRTVDVLRLLAEKGSVLLRDRLYLPSEA
ncbi:gas vesicle protein GvpN [Leptolyngbya sp. FACHB-321]|uniref:gas vesicle protein GvpN n=1 Tax=Leptolyngbya sp. FACHB-321 TaxID=2692807 RepID=UPI001684805A|nr:gas vesicle protein GvpN [Leptolyngbya sp. FACHB-321]